MLGESGDGCKLQRMASIERVETYGLRGKHEIRVYTQELIDTDGHRRAATRAGTPAPGPVRAHELQ
jgi:hypothetical protein